MNAKSKNIDCPCGSGKLYDKCCGRLIDGGQVASSAAELMRSRYTAYALRNEDYLRLTWWPDTLPEDALTSEDDVKWIGLKIVAPKSNAAPATSPVDADHATVEFIASFKVGGRAHKLHEISNFTRQTDAAGVARWYYVDGVFPEHD